MLLRVRHSLVLVISLACAVSHAEPWLANEPATWSQFQHALTAWSELVDFAKQPDCPGISMAQSDEVGRRLERVLRSPAEIHQTGRYIYVNRETVPADIQRARDIIKKGLDHYAGHRAQYTVLFYRTRFGELLKAWGLLTVKEQIAEPVWETHLPQQLRAWERFSAARVSIHSTKVSPSRRRELQLVLIDSLGELFRVAPSRALPFAQGLLDEKQLRAGEFDLYAEVVKGAIASQSDAWERTVGARLAWEAVRERSPACALVWGASLDDEESSVPGATVRLAKAMLRSAADPADDMFLRGSVILLAELDPDKERQLMTAWRTPPTMAGGGDAVAAACSRAAFDSQARNGLGWWEIQSFARRAGEHARRAVLGSGRDFVEEVMPYVLGCPEELMTAAIGLH